MGPLLFPTVFWCDAPEAGLIGAVSLFKFRYIKHLVVAAIILDYPWSLLRGTEGSNPSPSSGESVSAVNPGAVGEKPRTWAAVCGGWGRERGTCRLRTGALDLLL